MRTLPAYRGYLLCIGAALVCLCPRLIWADGEVVGGSSTESSTVTIPDLGTGMFSRFPLHLSVSARGGYDDNVSTTESGKQDSWFTSLTALLTYDLGTPRTTMTLATTAGFSYYFANVQNQYEPNFNLTMSLTHKASPRLTFTVTGFASYQTEPDFQYGLGTNRRVGNYFSTQDKFGVAYAWTPRFSTETTYIAGIVHYDDSAVGLFEDRFENTFGNAFRFMVLPTTMAVAEYRFGVVSYQHDITVPAVIVNGVTVVPEMKVQRDSTTQFILAGIDHVFSSRLSASVRGGAEFRDYQDTGSATSPYFEGTLNYVVGKDTTASWTNRYGIEEGDVATNPTRKTFRTGLQATHKITSRITGNVSAFFTHADYEAVTTPGLISPSFTEDAFDFSLSARYAFTRYVGVEAGYDHAEVSSALPGRDYDRNRVWGGLNVAF